MSTFFTIWFILGAIPAFAAFLVDRMRRAPMKGLDNIFYAATFIMGGISFLIALYVIIDNHRLGLKFKTQERR
jgi:hypothetical protein